jgi:hypothetical protein
MTDAERTQLTYRHEKWRSACAGVLETAASTFLLLLAGRFFDAGPVGKALVASGVAVGHLLSPLVVNTAQRLGWPPTRAVSRLLWTGAAACLLTALLPRGWGALYVGAATLAMAMTSAAVPLMTQVYQDNYPAHARGKLYSRTFMLRIAAAAGFAWLAGQFLEPQPGLWRWLPAGLAEGARRAGGFPERFRALLVAFALAFAVAARAVRRIPSSPLPAAAGRHPLSGFRYVRADRLFRQALIAWMLMGFANLAMLPLRVEYLGNPRHGLARPAGEIALLTLVIPNLARLLLSPVWGRLFDRMNFFTLRVVLNLGFALGIGAFFTSDGPAGLIAGAVIYGVSNAGGDVAWGLWVTKFAPADRVADYMSVHTFLTGVRGVLAPLAAFQAVQHWTPATMGWAGAGLIVAATLILVPEIWSWRAQRRGENLAEEISD